MPMLENSRVKLYKCHRCGKPLAAACEIGMIPGTDRKAVVPIMRCPDCNITLYSDASDSAFEEQRSAAKASA